MNNEKIIMQNSDESAQPYTMTGWKSRRGMFFADEISARYDGCTHVSCKTCGEPTPRGYTVCGKCRDKIKFERYKAMPTAEWDGISMLYSETTDKFYGTPEDAYDEIEKDEDLSELRLVICKLNYVRPLEGDYCVDELAEDMDVPAVVAEAMDAFNAAVDGIALSWSPSKVALKVSEK